MKLTFYGAAGEVTGSCTLLETKSARVLIDFGLHQGGVTSELKNRHLPPIDPTRLDAILLTHAHIDHCGRLPLLANTGFKSPIYATPATVDLCTIMLRDSASVQEHDAEKWTQRRLRQGKPPVTPLYTEAEVEKTLPLFKPVPLETPRELAPGITARYVDAGHMLGSASIELTVTEPGSAPKTIAFSGDIGVKGAAMLNDPTPLTSADLVILESTYGDRNHLPLADTLNEFEAIVQRAVWDKEKILIPSFAIGRSQQMIYYLGELIRANRLPRFPVYLDSPMAIAAMALFKQYQSELDTETTDLIRAGTHPLFIPDLRCTTTGAESRVLNSLEGAAVIIAASGMCTGGRILHHLRHNLWRRDVHVVIAGFQAAGSIGRQLVDGARTVRIMGDNIASRAKIHTLGGFSSHAGQNELLGWARNFTTKPRFVLNHGEPKARNTLRGLLEHDGATVAAPEWGQSVEL